MVNSKSAKKRVIINKRNKLQNKFYKNSARTLSKAYFRALSCGEISKNPAKKQILIKILSSFYSIMDKGTKKNIFHKNTTARRKKQLAKYLKLI